MKTVKSFTYAIAGILTAIKAQTNIKIHIAIMTIALGCGWYFDITAGEWCMITLASALVISLELVNTAIEHLTDLVMPRQHPISGKVKDTAAGAVLVSAVGAFITGVIIFAKYI